MEVVAAGSLLKGNLSEAPPQLAMTALSQLQLKGEPTPELRPPHSKASGLFLLLFVSVEGQMDEEIVCPVLSVTAPGVISLFWQQMLARIIYIIFNIYQSPMTHLTTNSNILYLVHGYKKAYKHFISARK